MAVSSNEEEEMIKFPSVVSMIDISQQPLSFLAVFVLLDCNLEKKLTKPPSSHHPNQGCPGRRTITPALLKLRFVFFFCIWGGEGVGLGGNVVEWAREWANKESHFESMCIFVLN